MNETLFFKDSKYLQIVLNTIPMLEIKDKFTLSVTLNKQNQQNEILKEQNLELQNDLQKQKLAADNLGYLNVAPAFCRGFFLLIDT